MVKNANKKTGFTLIEILIALVILALFFVASMKILTVKPSRQYLNSIHGLYECYYNGSTLMYHKVEEEYNQTAKNAVGGSYCTFEPSKNVAFYNIIIILKQDSSDSLVYTSIQPAINKKLNLYPESGANAEIWDAGADIATCREQIKTRNDACESDYVKYTYITDDEEIQQNELEKMKKSELKKYLETTTKNKSEVKNLLESDYKGGAIIIKW